MVKLEHVFHILHACSNEQKLFQLQTLLKSPDRLPLYIEQGLLDLLFPAAMGCDYASLPEGNTTDVQYLKLVWEMLIHCAKDQSSLTREEYTRLLDNYPNAYSVMFQLLLHPTDYRWVDVVIRFLQALLYQDTIPILQYPELMHALVTIVERNNFKSAKVLNTIEHVVSPYYEAIRVYEPERFDSQFFREFSTERDKSTEIIVVDEERVDEHTKKLADTLLDYLADKGEEYATEIARLKDQGSLKCDDGGKTINYGSCLPACVKILQHSSPVEKTRVVKYLLTHAEAIKYEPVLLQDDAFIHALAELIKTQDIMGTITELAIDVRQILSIFMKASEVWRVRIVEYEIMHEGIKLIPSEFYKQVVPAETFMSTSQLEQIIVCLHNGTVVMQLETLERLGNASTAVLDAAIEGDLLEVLLQLEHTRHDDDKFRACIWKLLVCFLHLFPRVGVANYKKREQLIQATMEVLARQTHNDRRYALEVLLAPIHQCKSVYDVIANRNGIAFLIDLLCYEEDDNTIDYLVMLIRKLIAASQNYAVDVDASVRNTLQSHGSTVSSFIVQEVKHNSDMIPGKSVNYENLMALYRAESEFRMKPHDHNDYSDIFDCIGFFVDVLHSGNELEQWLALRILQKNRVQCLHYDFFLIQDSLFRSLLLKDTPHLSDLAMDICSDLAQGNEVFRKNLLEFQERNRSRILHFLPAH